ncbi:MAG: hypothetical protein KBD24_01935 [Candidatus Pacebacteria bacterium]|nr:hypothetical protein [Candidatus Paceibacterota bacterium]
MSEHYSHPNIMPISHSSDVDFDVHARSLGGDVKNQFTQSYRFSRYVFLSTFYSLLLSTFFFLPSTPAYAATYSLSPAGGSYGVGQTFQVRVMADSAGAAVNTGDATITFDDTKLSAVSASKEGSPFNLWVTEPKISGSTITFAGGGTTPISGSKAVVTITFKGKAEGSAKVDITKGTLLAGAGQNVLTGQTGATYTITPASATPTPTPEATPPKKTERVVNIPVPEPPVIKSESHPDQTLWYSVANAKFSWDIPYGVTSLKVGFGTEEKGEPTELREPPIGTWNKEGLTDGTWYFHAVYKNRGGWSSSTDYKINIDTTPPEEFSATATGGDLTAQVRFEAKDTLSGIASYRIGVDEGRTRDVQPSELSGGGYTLTNLDPGSHTITVTAIDKAGNERESGTSVEVTGTKPVEQSKEVQTSGFGAIYWVSLLFMAALAVVVTMLLQERRRHTEEKDRLKREAAEAGDKLINIFGVLRDEIEEKVLELSHKPNMTDNERNILEALKDALDISEELIDKEIEDVRKLLK